VTAQATAEVLLGLPNRFPLKKSRPEVRFDVNHWAERAAKTMPNHQHRGNKYARPGGRLVLPSYFIFAGS
jgi:hypothetical protein